MVENLAVLAESFGPIGVAENDEAVSAGNFVVGGREETTEGGAEAEDGEVGTGYEAALGGGGVTLIGEVGAEAAMGGDAAEDGLAVFEVAEHGIAEDGFAVAGVVGGVAAAAGAVGGEVDEFSGVGGGKGAEEDLFEEGEDGRIGPDAEGEGEDGDEGNDGSLAEGAEGETEIAHGELQ